MNPNETLSPVTEKALEQAPAPAQAPDELDLRIPAINENRFDAVNTGPRKDVIYQVTAPDGSLLRKYVNVTEVFGDKGLALCNVVRCYHENGEINSKFEGEQLAVDFERQVEPDVFPQLAIQVDQWTRASAMSLAAIQQLVSAVIDNHLRTVTAYDMHDDTDRTLKGIKTLLKGKIGGFFLTLLMAYIAKKLTTSLSEKLNTPKRDEKFNRRLAETHSLYSKPGPAAMTRNDEKTKTIEKLQKQVETLKKASETEKPDAAPAKPAPKPKLIPKPIPKNAKINPIKRK